MEAAEACDATTPAELGTYASSGSCRRGEGNMLMGEGRTSLTGDIAVNASGRLSARNRPDRATGFGQAAEIVRQLRSGLSPRQIRSKSGEGARIGLVQNHDGTVGAGVAMNSVGIFIRE